MLHLCVTRLSGTSKSLQTKIRNSEGISPDQRRLIFAGLAAMTGLLLQEVLRLETGDQMSVMTQLGTATMKTIILVLCEMFRSRGDMPNVLKKSTSRSATADELCDEAHESGEVDAKKCGGGEASSVMDMQSDSASADNQAEGAQRVACKNDHTTHRCSFMALEDHSLLQCVQGASDSESTVAVKVAGPEPQFRRSMQIYVKSITGKSIAIIADPSDTILDVKTMLQDRLLIPTCQQGLVFRGRQLQDAHTVSHYGIRKRSTLHMVARLRGGVKAISHEDSRRWTVHWSSGRSVTIALDRGRFELFGKHYQLRATSPVSFVWSDGTVQSVESFDGCVITWSTTSVDPAQQRIQWVLQADIQKYAADASLLSKEIAELEDISVWTGDIKAATKVREIEQADYDALLKDYSDSVDALRRAIAVLKQSYGRKQASLMQVKLADWVDERHIIDTNATKPETWDDEEDGDSNPSPEEAKTALTDKDKTDIQNLFSLGMSAESIVDWFRDDGYESSVVCAYHDELAAVAEAPKLGADPKLLAELKEMTLHKLKQRALEIGCDEKSVQDVDVADDPKEAVIDFIVLRMKAKTALTDKDKTDIQNMFSLRMSAESIVDWFHEDGYESSVVRAYLDELAAAAKAQRRWRCTWKHGVRIRSKPDLGSGKSSGGDILQCGETFHVSEEKEDEASGITITFLKMADGRGWVFDRDLEDTVCELVEEQTPWRCTWKDGVWIRQDPVLDLGRRSGDILQYGETFHVSEKREESDKVSGATISFLKMADGRGWVFDRDLQDTVCELVDVEVLGDFGTEQCCHEIALEHVDGDIRNFGRKLVVPWSADEAFRRRQQVLHETLRKLSTRTAREEFHKFARTNVSQWQLEAASKPRENNLVFILCGDDWGKLTGKLTKRFGKVFAVLNMANAYVAGGGYLEGCPAQEENMFRRSDCHFSVTDEEFDQTEDRYCQHETDLINAVEGRVYLDVKSPRVCIRGPETDNGHGYHWLDKDEVFLFYEMRAAAVDHRPTADHQEIFSEPELQRRINAQLDTLVENGIRNVVLSAFGCGAFLNPATAVAKCYRVALESRATQFDCIAFAVYYPGYGPDNLTPFKEAFASSPMGVVGG